MSYQPIYKNIHPFYESEPGILRLGEFNAIETDDPNGSIYYLVTLMDGKRTIEELHTVLRNKYSEITLEEMLEVIEELNRLGYIYDQKAELATSLSPTQRERFKGNLNFFSLYSNLQTPPSFFQEKLLNCHVTILGMGAFGCSVLFNLAGLGVRNVRIVDFDTVSLSNLNRQMLFNENNIDQPKIDVAKEFMGNFYSDMNIETISMQIRSTEDVNKIIENTDLVVVAADQPMMVIGRWINKACVARRIPFITGGLNLDVAQTIFIEPYKTGCLDCAAYFRGKESPFFVPILERFMDSNQVPPNMATAPGLQLATSMMAKEIMIYLSGISVPESLGSLTRLNLISFDKTKLDIKRSPEHCPTCGNGDGEEPIFKNIYYKPEYHLRELIDR